MKRFSISNKPAIKANNKQSGIVFLEYVIMAFIVTVAVICALWWFYWHLQQMTWETKQKLDTLKTLTCPLETPYGAAPGDQPTAFYQKSYNSTAVAAPDWDILVTDEIPYIKQKVVIHNAHNLNSIEFYVDYPLKIKEGNPGGYPEGWYYYFLTDNFTLGPGAEFPREIDNTEVINYLTGTWGGEWGPYVGPYRVEIFAQGPSGTPYTVNVTETPP